jgi:intergrase/recombinase
MLNGNLKDLDSFPKHKKNNVLKALIALSKYLGVYEDFKAKIKNYGIKWERQDSLESFLRVMKTREDLVEWVRKCFGILDRSMAEFLRFLIISGLRKEEAIKSFNLILKLLKEGKLGEYYNEEIEALEHFMFEKEFLRRTKNAFIPKEFIEEIKSCEAVAYYPLRRKLRKHGLGVRFNEIRDYFATFMVHHGLIKEEVDLLQGRVGKSIFMRHYFSPAIKELRERVFKAINEMMAEVT